MIASVFLFSLLACGVLGAPNYDERVIGGTKAKLGEIPYIVYIEMVHSNGVYGCGGSILDKNHILTAAHCVIDNNTGLQLNPNNVIIKYGVIDSESPDNNMRIKKIKTHDYYKRHPTVNDIAVLTLDGEIEFGPNVAATVLPSSNLNFVGNEIPAILSGWGKSTYNNTGVRFLLTAELPLFNDMICSKYLPYHYQSEYHICSGSLNGLYRQCNGDSGGPVYADGAQQGIVSFTAIKDNKTSCDTPHNPGVSTRVANYLDWIKEAMTED